MNLLVDIMIVGDSKSGHDLLDKLATSKPTINIAFVSQTFKSTTTRDYVNVKYFRNEVVYVSYRHRLFCCYMKNGDHIYSTHIVIASGVTYEPLMINNEPIPCVFNNVEEVLKNAKDQPALVLCNKDSDVKLALEVAKKYKQVYLCTKELELTKKVSSATAKKLNKAENIAVLPNTSISKAISKDGVLQKIELDNYSTVNCSAIYAKTDAKPATEYLPKKLIQRDDMGYLMVSDKCESTLVPKCYAAGNCLPKYTKAMEQALTEAIINDFN
jgi:thioredoxin reductase